ncbi:MAG: hypothetical protein PHR25_05810 [Clostridia bacterium]|nr:hypothetical protein [Clostridia bacterium]MDD4376280.1 hypothetical protein [Clostridia bacterium]MDD4376281.1 hypothetical protein [Clostridia bacterium]
MGTNEKKGISLIVLVITITVIIILTGLIVLSLNSSGIINKSKDSVNDYNIGQIQEIINFAKGEVELSKLENIKSLKEVLSEKGYELIEDKKILKAPDGKIYQLDENEYKVIKVLPHMPEEPEGPLLPQEEFEVIQSDLNMERGFLRGIPYEEKGITIIGSKGSTYNSITNADKFTIKYYNQNGTEITKSVLDTTANSTTVYKPIEYYAIYNFSDETNIKDFRLNIPFYGVIGDYNLDGKIDLLDTSPILRIAEKLDTLPSRYHYIRCSISNDSSGELVEGDAQLILQFVVRSENYSVLVDKYKSYR